MKSMKELLSPQGGSRTATLKRNRSSFASPVSGFLGSIELERRAKQSLIQKHKNNSIKNLKRSIFSSFGEKHRLPEFKFEAYQSERDKMGRMLQSSVGPKLKR